MTLSLPTVASLRVALGIARLQHPNDPRFQLAYQELTKEWTRELSSTEQLIALSRIPTLVNAQAD
jgi:hypothetical protein